MAASQTKTNVQGFWSHTRLESYKAVFQLYVYHTFISNLLMSPFLFLFQGAYGNPGEPGPSGDPVRLLIAVSVFGYS